MDGLVANGTAKVLSGWRPEQTDRDRKRLRYYVRSIEIHELLDRYPFVLICGRVRSFRQPVGMQNNRREGQCVLDQTASSESKDTDSYSTLYSRMPWHPAGSYGGALSPVSFCLRVAWKKSRDQCLSLGDRENCCLSPLLRFVLLRTGLFSRMLVDANSRFHM